MRNESQILSKTAEREARRRIWEAPELKGPSLYLLFINDAKSTFEVIPSPLNLIS